MPRRGDGALCVRKSAVWVQREYHMAVVMLSDHYKVEHMGAITEAALRWLVESMPDSPIRRNVLAKMDAAISLDHPSICDRLEAKSESPPLAHGGNGDPRLSTPGI